VLLAFYCFITASAIPLAQAHPKSTSLTAPVSVESVKLVGSDSEASANGKIVLDITSVSALCKTATYYACAQSYDVQFEDTTVTLTSTSGGTDCTEATGTGSFLPLPASSCSVMHSSFEMQGGESMGFAWRIA